MDDFLDQVRASLPARHDTVLMASYGKGVSSHRTYGADADADAELGSLTKGLTGLLYAQAIERGEVTGDTTLGDLLPLGTDGPATARLADVATHHSGLPRLPVIKTGRSLLSRTWGMWRRGENPYGDSLETLLIQARDTRLSKPTFAYSNLGFSLLGHALAAAAGTDYATLLRERVTAPMGMRGAYLANAPNDLSSSALFGTSKSGKPQAAWTGEGIAPAGGLRCTAADLESLLVALCDGTAPGISALEPIAEIPGKVRIGAGWLTSEVNGRPLTWHNGQTGGFASWLGVDRETSAGFAMATATSQPVDKAGVHAIEALRS